MSPTLSERKNERPKLPKLGHVARAFLVGELGEALGPEDRDQRIAGQDSHDDEDHDRHADHR
jgi:hypothetical protein